MARMRRGSRCSICAHPERTKIEALCAGGNAQSAIAKEFGLDQSQLSRHMNGTPKQKPHVSPREMTAYLCGATQVEELRLIATKQAGTVLDDAMLGKAMIFKAMADAATAKDVSRLSAAAGRFLDFLEFIGQRTGEIARLNPAITVNNSTTVNITASPQFVRLQRGLMKLVVDYPEVRSAVAAMLADCEAEERRGDFLELEAPRAAA